jgi:hypothetical protein
MDILNESFIDKIINIIKVETYIHDLSSYISFTIYLPLTQDRITFKLKKETFSKIRDIILDVDKKINEG